MATLLALNIKARSQLLPAMENVFHSYQAQNLLQNITIRCHIEVNTNYFSAKDNYPVETLPGG